MVKKRQSMSKGRPTKYDESFNQLAYNYALLGATDKNLAEFLGVCEATVNTWKQDYPQFLESIKKGKEKADAKVAESLYKRATGFQYEETKEEYERGILVKTTKTKKTVAPETTAQIFWLKNRQKAIWRDKQEKQVDLKVSGFDIDKLSDQTIKDIINASR